MPCESPTGPLRAPVGRRRRLAVGAGVGLVTGFVVGGLVGRVYMRLVFLAEDGTLGFETAMGAVVGTFSVGGTLAIGVFGALAGIVIGLAYGAAGPLLPGGGAVRTAIFVLGTTALLTGQIARANADDFAFLPVTLSLALTALAVAFAALPVPWLVDRAAPVPAVEARRSVAHAAVAVSTVGFLAYGITGAVSAYAVDPLF